MVLLLAEVLDVPLGERNTLLRSAGFDPVYPESSLHDALSGHMAEVLDTMLEGHEPYPMIVLDRCYRILRSNVAAVALIQEMGLDLSDADSMMEVVFEPERGRRLVVNWEEVASALLLRLQRQVFRTPEDLEVSELLDRVLTEGEVPDEWRVPDLEVGDLPALTMVIRLDDGTEVGFLATLTTFADSRDVALEEVLIESWFPADPESAEICRRRLVLDPVPKGP